MTHVRLDLNAEELPLLEELLRDAVGNIQVEIHHTRTPSYKDQLRHQREVLIGLAGRIRCLSGSTAFA